MCGHCDRETGAPPRRAGILRAYLKADDNEVAKFRVDLNFRERFTRKTKMVHDSRALVCPAERNAYSRTDAEANKSVTCESVNSASTEPTLSAVQRKVMFYLWSNR